MRLFGALGAVFWASGLMSGQIDHAERFIYALDLLRMEEKTFNCALHPEKGGCLVPGNVFKMCVCASLFLSLSLWGCF